MNVAEVMDELGAALDTIDGLRVFPYWADRITPPVAIVGYPEQYTFDQTYGRGQDYARFPVTVAVGRFDARSSRDRIAKYADGSGVESVKAAIDGHDTAVWDVARVAGIDQFEVLTVGNVEYLSATFNVDIYARGGS